ncbi:MAG: hypothetical protein ACRC4W_08990 [Treponemataceae bacterium]
MENRYFDWCGYSIKMSDFNNDNNIISSGNGKEPPEKITFYYNREQRLKKHPEHKKLYNGELIPRRGLFQVLVATPGSKFLFIAMLFLSAVLVIFMFTGNDKKSTTIAEIPVKIEGFLFDQTLYVTITLAEKLMLVDEKKVEILIGIYDNEKRLLDSKKIEETYTGEKQLLRTTFTNGNSFSIISKINIDGQEGILSINNLQ